jgi:cell division protease FtsH
MMNFAKQPVNNANRTPDKTPPNTNPTDPKTPEGNGDRRIPDRRQMGFVTSYLLVGLVVLWLFQQFILGPMLLQATEIPYSEFKSKLHSGEITNLVISDDYITGQMKNTDAKNSSDMVPFGTVAVPQGDTTLIAELDKAGIKYSVKPPASPIGNFIVAWILPMALLAGVWYFLFSRVNRGGGMGNMLGVGKSKANSVKPEDVGVTYKDVGGADQAIVELQEIIQFLKNPSQFSRLGGRIPKGVLLVGPPGTGKTLLAKATAGEAHVSFFETSGSEFVEMFVGVGAARVRDLFEKARSAAPAVIFIDEIDAIGQSRSAPNAMGSNDEREQTLNPLLTEIDGFNNNENDKPVILMAATNRPETLDPALLRAGRFDRQVAVSNPDLAGRLQILQIHSSKIKLAENFDMQRAARMTPGFSGADLANLMNEAALLAARRNAEQIEMQDFEAAIERVVAGLEQRSRVLNEQERRTVAYHESGHALVAALVEHADPVAKISIVPHGRGALGYTMQMPTEDRFLLTQEELQDRIAVILGGRAAEKVVFDVISTGASDDIMRGTELARRMVTEFGMSESLGVVRYAGQQYQYLGGTLADNSAISPETRRQIDEEVKRIISEQYQRAQSLLLSHREALEKLSLELLEKETVDGSAIQRALN